MQEQPNSAVRSDLTSKHPHHRDLSQRLSGQDSESSNFNALTEDFDSFAIEALEQACKVSGVTARLAGDVSELDEALERQHEKLGEVSTIAAHRTGDFLKLAEAAEAAARESAAASARTIENESFIAEIGLGLEELGQLVLKSEQFMQKLLSELASIDSLVGSLADISERLGVLAINTAIEAARSGEKGRGFTIIAKEIQALSKSAFTETKSVGDRVGSVKNEVGIMTKALGKSNASVSRSMESAKSISGRFSEITAAAKRLDMALKEHAEVVDQNHAAQGSLSAAMGEMAAEGQRISRKARSAEQLSGELGEVVNDTLKTMGAYHTSLHKKALQSLEEICRSLPIKDLLREADSLLLSQFSRHAFFELFYLMDSQGTQISSNIVNPRYKNAITSNARGRSWKDKAYFSVPRQTKASYVSDIYISEASGKLCLTVSLPLMEAGEVRAVLAADLNVDDLAQLQRSGKIAAVPPSSPAELPQAGEDSALEA